MQPQDVEGPDAIDVEIGARLRFRRRQLGLTQGEVAQRIGVSAQRLQNFERGVRSIPASSLVLAAGALETSVAWLVDEEGEGDEAGVFTLLLTNGALEMLQAFAAVASPRQRAALVSLARDMAGLRRDA